MTGERVKDRLDVLLVEKGLAASRERAKAYIMAGLVTVDGKKVDKAGTMVPGNASLLVHGDNIGYVSRGGLKLAKALAYFGLDLTGKVMADIGASTGGFTDCALKNGVAKVYAIDVGYGQLAWSLRTDERVINMERTNIRNVRPEDLNELLDFVSIDVAFISLDKVLPVVKTLLKPQGIVVALIKPQFEAGRDKVGKKGVVRDPAVHCEVINNVVEVAARQLLTPAGLTYSPVKGPEGNIEYLLYLTNYPVGEIVAESNVAIVVAEAHANLTG
ncbi:TlyA family RNA methyltransferase [Sporomusa acidovorans]|uniref:16S/23S rRNA (Cytidine-2'-O)-methyltransferase TlyA n=1 Tax=Sporomusa acidovorans (strain ATCC 49682 / DSM 3132 / Mol) TaxID=1123286 RepID=A0ABZ3J3E8_SPOA4|nr:TlyA family RNA methyltransferase [Sporomusa acidovorans]OZC20359.1 16S/23S rRNA (cytidine-2'-O)-methyltransferase TlyA [Sporomusa acidovorans DSM 3132]SDD36623.1 23S rRNA (cytidine1920-2'-O)/16S rRNA (cytidine1409-2'-O)-methyltransferase [Sporomusa acidovorans]